MRAYVGTQYSVGITAGLARGNYQQLSHGWDSCSFPPKNTFICIMAR
jgi:hypothetical protein